MKFVGQICCAIFSIASFFPISTYAWNALGHKVICEIAWQQLDTVQRKAIVDTLKRHPRFAQDFAPDMPQTETDRWIFHQAGVWPDIARGIRGPERDRFDKPIWHYINFPITAEGYPSPKLNLSVDPSHTKSVSWNVTQATVFCLKVIKSDDPPAQKALAYSWLFHLVGDMHQPMHSTALFSERFPKGDRGGNSIKLVKGKNLHSLWDNLIGRSHNPNNVLREVAQLRQRPELWEIDTKSTPSEWVAESHKLAKSVAYSTEILDAVLQSGELHPILLPETYFKQAGRHAQARIVAAGLRLAVLLGAKIKTNSEAVVNENNPGDVEDFGFEPQPIAPRVTTGLTRHSAENLAHWLNTNSNVRHNSTCRHYGNTAGRKCSPNEGKPCGICGG